MTGLYNEYAYILKLWENNVSLARCVNLGFERKMIWFLISIWISGLDLNSIQPPISRITEPMC